MTTTTAVPSTSTTTPTRPATGRWGFGHVPALDGLRGAAVAVVLAFHAGHLTGGYLGVDLFFVLSGYLITSLLLAEHTATGAVALGAFWGRRVRRLLPALVLLLLGVALYARVVARPVDLGGIRADGLATLGYVANWHTILRGTSYWDLSLAPSPLQHVWSLAIEEQFYLLWPLVVAVLARRAGGDLPRTLGRVALTGAAISAALFVGLHAFGSSDTRVYEGTDTRAAALLLGVALAAQRHRHPVTSLAPAARARAETAGLVAAALLVALWLRLDGQSAWLYRGGLPVASVLAVVVVAAASDPSSPVLGRACSLRPLRWLGTISYGLYLWHWPVFQAVDIRNGQLPLLGDRFLTGAALFVLKVVLSLALAVLSYRLVESPIRRGGIRRPFGIPAALVGLAVAGLVVWVSTAGAVAVVRQDRVEPARSQVPGGPVVVFAGDSVAQSIESRVADDPMRYGVNPVGRTYPGCSVVAIGRTARDFAGGDSKPPSCARAARRDLPATVDVVYLLVGVRPNDAVLVGGRFQRACDRGFNTAYLRSTAGLVRDLRRDTGGAPVVLGTVAHSGAQAIRVRGSEERIDCVNRLIGRVAELVPGTSVVDVNELLCPPGRSCVEELDGGPVRSDGIHFDDGPGGARVADWIVEHMLDVADAAPAPGTGPGS